MFDPPERVPYSHYGTADIDTPAHRALALDAAHQSMVLLKVELCVWDLSSILS
jgi:beta-glucosidase